MAVACSHCRGQVGFWAGLMDGTLCAVCRPVVRKARRQWEAALEACLADRILTIDEERQLNQLAKQLTLTTEDLAPLLPKLERARRVSLALLGQPMPVQANIALKPNEVCWFMALAILYEERIVRRYVRGSRGVSIRIAKGVSYRIGASRGYSVPESQVVAVGEGSFYITSQRCLFIGSSKTITVKLKDLIAFDPYEDGVQLHHDQSDKVQIFKFSDGEYAAALLSGALTPVSLPPSAQIASHGRSTPPGATPGQAAVSAQTLAPTLGVRLRVIQVLAIIGLIFLAPVGITIAWWQRLWSLRVRVGASIASAAFFIYVLLISGPRPKTNDVEPDPAIADASAGLAQSLHVPEITALDFGSADQRFLTQSEKKYFRAASAYLQALGDGDAALVAIIAGVRDGRAELNNIKATSERARTQQANLYARHFADVSVPSIFAATHRKLQLCEIRHDAAVDELLSYWHDLMLSHLEKGTVGLGAAIAATNDAAADLKTTTAGIVIARKKMAGARKTGSGSPAARNEGSQPGKGSAASPSEMQPVDPYATEDESRP